MLIQVTEDDIINGVRSDCARCPIALAMKRAFPEWDDPQVGVGEINMTRVIRDNGAYIYARIILTNRISSWIKYFDHVHHVQHGKRSRFRSSEPIEFELPEINATESDVYKVKE